MAARFCVECGSAFGRVCPTCSENNPISARFCGQCGIALAAPISFKPSAPGSEGELKQITVFFADVEGSTELIEGLDPEAAAKRLAPAISAMQEAVLRYEGSVVKVQGDGVMAVFGAPEPMPGHARAAVQAACEVVSVVRRLTLGASEVGMPIEVGVGVATGRAFVGNIQTNDRFVYTAVGDVVNLASRIERLTRELAAAVAIDAHTHRSAGDAAALFRRHERVTIRGRAEPVDVYSLPLAAA